MEVEKLRLEDAEVPISNIDKERLRELLTEADSILDKYQYSMNYKIQYVTSMSRAKGFVKEAKKWCSYLRVK